MKDKFDIILFVVTILVGILIIWLIPNGRHGYWLIPLIFNGVIRHFRRISKDK